MSGSPYVLNIVELQNVQTSATGLSDIQQFSDMIDTINKTVRLNVLRSYDTAATSLTVTDTTVALSNAFGSEVDLRVYGNVYASNYYSLCPLRFWVGSEQPYEAMHVTEAGRIGVGTSTPAALMDIRGDMRIGGNVWSGGSVVIEGDVIIRGSLRVEGELNYET
jgi:hypothetical protein